MSWSTRRAVRLSAVAAAIASAAVPGAALADSLAPVAPRGLQAAAGDARVVLSWTASVDRGGSGLAGYRVYRDGRRIGGTRSTAYVSKGLVNGRAYKFTVRAFDKRRNGSGAARAVRVQPRRRPARDRIAPSAPANLRVAVNGGSITLTWSAASENVGVSGYLVYRDGVMIATTTATSHVDGQLSSGRSYSYKVRAYDAAGNVGGASASVTAAPQASASPPPPAPQASPAPPPPPAPTAPLPPPAPPAPPSGGMFGFGNWPGGSWRPFASTSPFYQRIPASPQLVGNSAAIVNRLFNLAPSSAPPVIRVGANGKQGGTPTFFSQPSDPLFTLHCTRSWGGCGIDGAQVRIPAGARPENGVASSGTDSATDSHMTIIDQTTGFAYDLWQVQTSSIPSTGGTLNVSYGGKYPLSGDGLGTSAVGGGGATAALFSDTIGRPRVESLESGEIPHAITVVMNCSNGTGVYPSLTTGTGTRCSNPTNAPPMGSRFQLDYSDAEIDALPAPAHRKVLYRAMAHYGLIMGDTEGDRLFSLELDSDYTYNSLGGPSKWLDFAKSSSGWTFNGSEYASDLNADGIDWHRLRVIAPCVSQRTC